MKSLTYEVIFILFHFYFYSYFFILYMFLFFRTNELFHALSHGSDSFYQPFLYLGPVLKLLGRLLAIRGQSGGIA